MLLRHYLRRVVRAYRPIKPRERPIIVAAWKVGFTPKRAAGILRALDGPAYTLENPYRRKNP